MGALFALIWQRVKAPLPPLHSPDLAFPHPTHADYLFWFIKTNKLTGPNDVVLKYENKVVAFLLGTSLLMFSPFTMKQKYSTRSAI